MSGRVAAPGSWNSAKDSLIKLNNPWPQIELRFCDSSPQLLALPEEVATIERFYIVLSLLQNQPDLSQRELESASAAIAAQLSVLYGINSPDFFEKSLFSSFVGTLKNSPSSLQKAAESLEPAIAITMNPDIRHNILQAVSRNSTN